MIKLISHQLAGTDWPDTDKQAIWACCVVAFFTSARVGELLASRDSSFDPTATLTWDDIKFRADNSAIITISYLSANPPTYCRSRRRMYMTAMK